MYSDLLFDSSQQSLVVDSLHIVAALLLAASVAPAAGAAAHKIRRVRWRPRDWSPIIAPHAARLHVLKNRKRNHAHAVLNGSPDCPLYRYCQENGEDIRDWTIVCLVSLNITNEQVARQCEQHFIELLYPGGII